MTNMELVAAELAAAKQKHPHFIDRFIDRGLWNPQWLRDSRAAIADAAKYGFCDIHHVLACEGYEAFDAYASGDLAHARQELAQVAAVAIRGMEWIEAEMAEKGEMSADIIALDSYAYPESDTINGKRQDDPTPENPPKRPFLTLADTRWGGKEWRWSPRIDAKTGTVIDWPSGMTASIYDKPCDDCAVMQDGVNLNAGEYIPAFLRSIRDDDYLVMDIGPDGKIAHWTEETYRAFCAWRDERKAELAKKHDNN